MEPKFLHIKGTKTTIQYFIDEHNLRIKEEGRISREEMYPLITASLPSEIRTRLKNLIPAYPVNEGEMTAALLQRMIDETGFTIDQLKAMVDQLTLHYAPVAGYLYAIVDIEEQYIPLVNIIALLILYNQFAIRHYLAVVIRCRLSNGSQAEKNTSLLGHPAWIWFKRRSLYGSTLCGC